MNFSVFFLSFSCLVCFSCCDTQTRQINATLEQAGENRLELEKVLYHYRQEQPDEQKLRAARFLLAHMEKKISSQGMPLEAYKRLIIAWHKPMPGDTLTAFWKEAQTGGNVNEQSDVALITADYLIRHIDTCVDGWRASPWRDEVTFEDFCFYILPYRIIDEQLSNIWIDSLRQRYQPMLKGVTDLKRAFALINKKIKESFREMKPACPYTLDVLTLDNLKIGICKDECVLTGAICRALSIPVAYDYVNHWTNYSRKGHSWIALVISDSTFICEKTDSLVRKAKYIPASHFVPEYALEKEYPYQISSQKRVSKVYRSLYGPIDNKDVSKAYGLNLNIEMKVKKECETAYLCTFRTGYGWMPVDATTVKRGRCQFEQLGGETIYLLMEKVEKDWKPLSMPFILHDDGRTEFLYPDNSHKMQAVLMRKYPLFANWTNQWHKMIGGRLEVSNKKDFSKSLVVDTISTTPVYRNVFTLPISVKSYRYIRYVCPDNCRTPLAELEIYDNVTGKRIEGKPIGSDFFSEKILQRPFDNDLMSVCSTKQKFWIGLDMKSPMCISKIILYPKNDGNFIHVGDLYELYYYSSCGWKSLGKQRADDFQLIYEVPANALLWLRNISRGNEERIFVYKKGKQIWY